MNSPSGLRRGLNEFAYRNRSRGRLFRVAPSTAQTFSFDPLKDLESAIPSGVPNESRILQARLQIKEVAQDALASL